MKKYCFLFLISVFGFACQNKLNLPENSENNLNINSLLTLEYGKNSIYLQDFILNTDEIDSVSCQSEYLTISLSADKKLATVQVEKAMEQMVDIKIWSKGTPYSVPCRKTDKTDFTFTFNPQGKTYKKVQIAGQMNDWTPSRMPDLILNQKGLYEITMSLSPGSYLYQMAIDGDQNHDPNNPNKVDNGFGKFNSILQVSGKNDSFPVLITHDFDKQSIILTSKNKVSDVFAYWQNYRLPQNFIKQSDGKLTVSIPAEAKNTERSFIRVWASNEFGISNDILVPLTKGIVLTDAKEIKRTDKHAQIMYFMLIDRFMNGNKNNDKPLNRPDVKHAADFWGGDLAGLQQKITDGYFEKLGINTLWISPLNQNPFEPYGYNATGNTKFAGYHGYWPISSSQVDTRFGSNDELKKLVATAHDTNINILLDYVANHVHEQHPLYKNHPEYFTNLKLPDGTLNVAKWDEHRLTTWFDTFMPSIDDSDPKVVDIMTDSALFWLKEFNLDGFRHDACKHISEEFWRTLTYKMKRELKGKLPYQIGETYGSSKLIASYLTTGMLDGQFDFNVYDIANTTFAGMGGGDLTRVQDVFKSSLSIFGTHNLMGYISGNHDKPRFMALASGDIKPGEDSKIIAWTKQIGITDSTAYDKMLLFHAFNLTIPGIPVIYYGDEIGMTGANDPDCRRMMRFDGWNMRENKLWNKVATLTHLRKNNPALIYGDFINIETKPESWIYARKYFCKEAIVIFNNSAKSSTFEVDLPNPLSANELKAAFNTKFSIKNQKLSISIPSYSVEILVN
jgi:cyclomaltodextrinase / maltogenic alpha-amylase / neopullulanase